jgi:hypothetical protein
MHNSTIYVFFLSAPTCTRKNTKTRIVHLLVLTTVLVNQNAQNEKYVQLGIWCMQQWSSQIHKRHVIHSNSAQHGLFWETWCSHTGVDENYEWWRVTKVWVERSAFILDCWPWRWRYIDQQTGKNVPDDLNLHQHRCENFTITNCSPKTSVRNYQFTLLNPKRTELNPM